MSLLPYFDVNPWFRRFFDHKVIPDDFTRYQPWWVSDGSSIKVDKNKWQINIDVLHFPPETITVKTADGYVVIEGKHEEREDEHGLISRHFVRRFKLPEGVNAELVESRLSSDGVLTVSVPYKEALKGERIVPITHTGPIRKEITAENEKESTETNVKKD